MSDFQFRILSRTDQGSVPPPGSEEASEIVMKLGFVTRESNEALGLST